ncbi:MAG: glycosyltransferase [Gammaproteobacteria bacterium]|nr:glycosyltransferase [Gammaproteobacteria bacterium]
MTGGLVLHTRVVTGGGGGPEKTIVNSPRFLQDKGYPMLCAYMRAPDDPYFERLLERAAVKGASIIAVDDHGLFDWRIARYFNALCKEHRPAIWHAHDYKSNLLGLLAHRAHPMRLVTTVHGWVQKTWKTPLYYAIDKMSLRRYEHVVCVSEDIYREVRGLGVDEDACTYVPNGVDTEEFCRAVPSGEVKARFGVAPGRLVVGAVGRLSDEKGFHLLIEAFVRTRARVQVDAELWIAGEGTEQRRLERLIAALGAEDRVKLLGFRKDTLDVFHAMDLFVLSSIREGLPNVVLEAMALELPVLCTKVASVPNVIMDGDNGLLTDTGSAPALEPGLERLLTDAKLRSALGAKARKAVVERHSFALRMQRIREIYDRVLQKPAP